MAGHDRAHTDMHARNRLVAELDGHVRGVELGGAMHLEPAGVVGEQRVRRGRGDPARACRPGRGGAMPDDPGTAWDPGLTSLRRQETP